MIDKNGGLDFSVTDIRQWKDRHATWVRSNLNQRAQLFRDVETRPTIELAFRDGSSSAALCPLGRIPPTSRDSRAPLLRRVVKLDLAVTNAGPLPATDINCWINLLGKVTLFDRLQMKSYWSDYPLDPLSDPESYFRGRLDPGSKKPLQQVFFSAIADELEFGVFESDAALLLRNPLPQPVATPVRPKLSGNEISFALPKLKQNTCRLVEPVFVLFHDKRCPIELEYRLNADQLTADSRGYIFIINKSRTAQTRQTNSTKASPAHGSQQ